jgi:hypothetical protein
MMYHGIQCIRENQFTEQELLEDEISTMHRHIEIMGNLIETLPL